MIRIKLWDQPAGYLAWDEKAGVAMFEYESSFMEEGFDFAPFTMSIRARRSLDHILWLGNPKQPYHGLPPSLADSLPGSWGNLLFNKWLKNNTISTKNLTPMDHLAFIGSNGMGALEFEPAQEWSDKSPVPVDVECLCNFAQLVLNERKNTVLNEDNALLWQALIKTGAAPGGKRPKAAIAIHKETGDVISGQGFIPEGYEHFLLKYDDPSAYPSARLEYIYYQMAVNAGISMMPSELRVYGKTSHFLTRRFDRWGNERIHTQTMAAMLPINDCYEDIFAIIQRLNLPHEDNRQQFLRMVFNVVARNVDDHSKNITFRMTPKGIWSLAPAYNLTFSADLSAPNAGKHALKVNGKNENITRADLEAVALNHHIHDHRALINAVLEAVSQFTILAKELGINKSITRDIRNNFNML